MQIPKRKSEQQRKHGDSDNYLSAEKIQELKQEIVKLEKFVRPKVVIDLTAAREMGDLSENAAYSYAKGKLMGIDRRLFEIKERIKNAIVIEQGAGEDGTVCIGCTVTVQVNGKKKRFIITGSQEADPSSGRISHSSPVGQLLLGHRAGETVSLKIGDREVEYLIQEVE
ncbi:MAG: GreA/GreB family elongation factor [Patescibacteria group bacterium]